ncbi:MAG: hypothetical protein Tsb0010_11050 [Parvularculaceae bacterium]
MSSQRLFVARVLAAGATICFAPIAPASAQEPDDAALETLERNLQAIGEAESLDERRRDLRVTIPFEQVLSAPDNVELNLAYAREQIELGDLKEASAALERILLVAPDFHNARVLYGLVLYRLEMLERARFELEKALEGETLDPGIRAEAEVYLERIKRLQRTTRAQVTVTAGIDYDTNRNQSPVNGSLFLGIPVEPEDRNGDLAYMTSVQGRVIHDLGTQAGHALHAEAAYYRSDKVEVDSLDLGAASLALGGTWNFGSLSVTPRIRGAFYWLDDADYLQTLGGELELAYLHRPDFRSFVILRGDDEDFRAVPDFQAAALREGRRLSARAGFSWNPNATMTLTLEGLAMDKNAVVGFQAFERYGVRAQHAWLHRGGAYTLIGGWAEHSDYDRNDPFISPVKRDEWLYRGRFTAGAPISWFARGVNLPAAIAEINLIAQYEYEHVDSNIPNFGYGAHKASLLFAKRFAL